MPFDLSAVQSSLRDSRLDGWLLYDFRGINPLAISVLGLSSTGHRSRRWFYFIPAQGTPQKLVHAIETGVLDGLPGDRTIYLRWQELEAGLKSILSDAKNIALEYAPRGGNPYISRVDAGTVELLRSFGTEIHSSGDLIQQFQATLSDEQIAEHRKADKVTTSAFEMAWDLIAGAVRSKGKIEEVEVRDAILQHFAKHGVVTDHSPIVGVGPNGGSPHYETGTGRKTEITRGDLVLVDLWGKCDNPQGIYSDLTRMAVVGGEPTAKQAEVFGVVAAARDAGIARIRKAFAAGEAIAGWQVDRATREVIDAAGYGKFFTHRTGHSIGSETHGNGTHMDDWETHDERKLLPRTLFSIEPGIYLPEFGIRSEVNVLIDADSQVHVTGGPIQTAIHVIPV